jgi:uncharacterized protein (DUF2147 family)
MKTILLIVLLVGIQLSLFAQESIYGRWETVDDATGKAKSIVEIYEKDGQTYGKIVKIFTAADEEKDPICNECSDDRKNQKIIGMEIIRSMENDEDEWEDGTILDPENGKIYDCEIWREGNELKVRGYFAFLFRTQTWKKAD